MLDDDPSPMANEEVVEVVEHDKLGIDDGRHRNEKKMEVAEVKWVEVMDDVVAPMMFVEVQKDHQC